MKLGDHIFDGPNEEILVLERNGLPLVFRARAVLDWKEFESLCKPPAPKRVMTPKGEKILVDDKSYVAAMDRWSRQKVDYMILKSLAATPDLVWETVDMANPETWGNYVSELEKAYFTGREITLLVQLAWRVNSIDETKLEEARARFLAGQAAE